MTEILPPEKIYLSLYAEAQDFQHLHVYLIPRFADTPLDRRGPNIFEFLADAVESGGNQGDVQLAATVASGIREALARM